MKTSLVLLAAGIVAAGYSANTVLSAKAITKKSGKADASQPKEQPRILTAMPTNVSVQLVRCVRANVPEFGANNIVVLQYRLRKEGANTDAVKDFDEAKFAATNIKVRDAHLLSSFDCIRGVHDKSTHSAAVDTSNWSTGQTSEGYAWFEVPEHVATLDVFFPKTSPTQVSIEQPRPS